MMYKGDITTPRLIDEWAQAILKGYMRHSGEPLSVPVPIFDFAEGFLGLRLDIEDLRLGLKDASGVLIPDKRWVILNRKQSNVRLRFTLAHEVAHWLVDHQTYHQKSHGLELPSGMRTDDEKLRERRANHLAGAILMPKDMVLDEAKGCPLLRQKEIATFAATFGVSYDAMRIRLKQLETDLWPAVVRESPTDPSTVFLSDPASVLSDGEEPLVNAAFVQVIFPVLDHSLYRKLKAIRESARKLYVVLDEQASINTEVLLDLDCVDGFLCSSNGQINHPKRTIQVADAKQIHWQSITTGAWFEKLRLNAAHASRRTASPHSLSFRPDGSVQLKFHSLLNLGAYVEPQHALNYRQDARLFVRRAQEQGKRVVIVTGCFDMLSLGHVKFLKRAKESGDVLVVGLEDDNRIRMFKGPLRPVNTAAQRAEVMEALECVDYTFVIAGSPKTPLKEFYTRLHKLIRADVLVVTENDPHIQDRREEIESAGGELVVVRQIDSNSTTSLIRQFMSKVEHSDMLLVSKGQFQKFVSETQGTWRQMSLPLTDLEDVE